MKLTEREKWLMEETWNSSKSNDEEFDFWLSVCKSECGTTYTEKYLAKHAPKPESIIKTIDTDNLPDCEVLAFDGDDTMAVGRLYFYSNEETIMCINNTDEPLFYITHYIPQRDLINFIKSHSKISGEG